MKRNAMFGAVIAALVIIVVMAYIAMNILGAQAPNTDKYGTISGIVTDQNKIGIPGANVTLWTARWDSTGDTWVADHLANVSHNPQSTNNGSTAACGMYTFYTVPWGMYNVTAEKDGHTWYSVLLLGPGDAYKGAGNLPGSEYGTATHNIAIPDYTYTTGQ